MCVIYLIILCDFWFFVSRRRYKNLERHLRCVDVFTRRCLTAEQRGAFYSLYTVPTLDMQELCTEGGPYREGQYLYYIILFCILFLCCVKFHHHVHFTRRIPETRCLLAHSAHRVRAVRTSTPERVGRHNGGSCAANRSRWNFDFDRVAVHRRRTDNPEPGSLVWVSVIIWRIVTGERLQRLSNVVCKTMLYYIMYVVSPSKAGQVIQFVWLV